MTSTFVAGLRHDGIADADRYAHDRAYLPAVAYRPPHPRDVPRQHRGLRQFAGPQGSRYALLLTPGNVGDITAAPALLERAGRMRYVLADTGYDADRLRRPLRDVGAVPVIPGRRNRKRTVRYDKDRYRDRHLIENAFCRLKDFRRVATRYDKLAAIFRSGVALATAVALWL